MDKSIVNSQVFLEEAARLLEEGREVSFTPFGSSMLPFVRGGKDRVKLKKQPSVSPGDIVLARLPDRHVLHRVIGTEGEDLILMGDGNLSQTERCRRQDILGTVTEIQKGSRTVTPGKARCWRAARPVRKYMLAVYRFFSR